MPWTLYRYLLMDLIKLMVMWTVILSVLVSVAVAIKPLSDGLLSPNDLLKFVFYSAPTLLVFTTPFAGMFAATLVFCRLTADNEILAMSASGLSYRRILLPVLALGWVLSVGLFYLSNYVVPAFYVETGRMVQRDVTKLLVRKVREREPMQMEGLVIYADRARLADKPPVMTDEHGQPLELQPEQWLMLDGVAIGLLDRRTGMTRRDITAATGDALIYNVDQQPWVSVRMRDAMSYQAATGELAFAENWSIFKKLPRPLGDRPKFFSLTELRALAHEPERFDRVRDAKLDLIQQFAAEHLMQRVLRQLRDGRLVLRVPNENAEYTVLAPHVERKGQSLELTAREGRSIVVEYRYRGSESRQFIAPSARLWIDPSMPRTEPRVMLDLDAPRVINLRSPDAQTEHESLQLPPTVHRQPVTAAFQDQTIYELLAAAEQGYAGIDPVQNGAQRLRFELTRLALRVNALIHMRGISSISAFLLLWLGAVLAIRFRGRMPLVVYFWAFLMAVLTIIILHGGENLWIDPKNPYATLVGMPVMWSSVALLGAVIAYNYWKLSRN